MDWILDLLTTWTHDWELHLTTVLSLISTIHKSPQHSLSLFKHAVSSPAIPLATACNSGDSSDSRAQALLSPQPVQNSCQFSQSQQTTVNSGTLNPIVCCNCHLSHCNLFSIILSAGMGSSLYSLGADPTGNTISKNSFIVACAFVVAGTCIPSRCLAMNVSYDSTIPAFRRNMIFLSVCLSVCLSLRPSIYLWLYSSLLDLGRFFSLLILYTVGRTPWASDQLVVRPLPTHRTTQTLN
jgi:hypothetical protein